MRNTRKEAFSLPQGLVNQAIFARWETVSNIKMWMSDTQCKVSNIKVSDTKNIRTCDTKNIVNNQIINMVGDILKKPGN